MLVQDGSEEGEEVDSSELEEDTEEGEEDSEDEEEMSLPGMNGEEVCTWKKDLIFFFFNETVSFVSA